MRIYVLRHQKRYTQIQFMTPLSELGHELANQETSPALEKLNIDHVFSSPFLRTLQTIRPYIEQNPSRIVKVEYGLYERICQDDFEEKDYLKSVPKKWHQKFHLDHNYQSVVKKKEIKYNESIEDVHDRLNTFMKYLFKQYGDTNETILLVSHMSPIHILLEMSGQNIPILEIKTGQIIRIV